MPWNTVIYLVYDFLSTFSDLKKIFTLHFFNEKFIIDGFSGSLVFWKV